LPNYAVVSIADMEAVDLPAGVRWHPIRPLLGVRATGVSAYSAREAGETVVEPHDEASDGRGHEELYVVISGKARFTVGGDELDAGPGTLVLVRPGTHRAAVASEPGTLVLAVGGPPTFEPAGSEWLELARPHFESAPERAEALLDRGIEEIPESAAIPYGRALLAATHGRHEEAASELRTAIARDPRLRAEAEREPLLTEVARETHDSHG
jgi:mannose-6-phosphate isomerase-like protein (cupin superfamily)